MKAKKVVKYIPSQAIKNGMIDAGLKRLESDPDVLFSCLCGGIKKTASTLFSEGAGIADRMGCFDLRCNQCACCLRSTERSSLTLDNYLIEETLQAEIKLWPEELE